MTNSPEPEPSDFLGDPLSDVSRRERRNLLLSSATVILIVHAALVPTRISALGIELLPPARDSFMIVLAAVVVYFIGAFVIYGLSDLIVWRHNYQKYLETFEIKSRDWSLEDQMNYDELNLPSIAWLYRVSRPIAYARIVFEFALPVLVGTYAVYASLIRV